MSLYADTTDALESLVGDAGLAKYFVKDFSPNALDSVFGGGSSIDFESKPDSHDIIMTNYGRCESSDGSLAVAFPWCNLMRSRAVRPWCVVYVHVAAPLGADLDVVVMADVAANNEKISMKTDGKDTKPMYSAATKTSPSRVAGFIGRLVLRDFAWVSDIQLLVADRAGTRFGCDFMTKVFFYYPPTQNLIDTLLDERDKRVKSSPPQTGPKLIGEARKYSKKSSVCRAVKSRRKRKRITYTKKKSSHATEKKRKLTKPSKKAARPARKKVAKKVVFFCSRLPK